VRGLQLNAYSRFISRVLFCIFALFIVSETVYASESLSNDKWYSGGTLHRSTLAEWKVASYRNRLATASDFYVTLYKKNHPDIPNIESLKPAIVDFENGISEAAKEDAAGSQSTAQTAVIIWILMGNQ